MDTGRETRGMPVKILATMRLSGCLGLWGISVSRSVWLARAGLVLVSTVALGGFAVPAEAATTGAVSVVETTKVRYKAGKGRQNKVVVTRSGSTITVDDQVAIKAGAGCKAIRGDKTKVRCTTRKAPTQPSS